MSQLMKMARHRTINVSAVSSRSCPPSLPFVNLLNLFFQIEVRHNIPSSKNETCQFSLEIKVREEVKPNVKDSIPIMGRSGGETGNDDQNDEGDEEEDDDDDDYDYIDDDERERKARKCRKNPKPKSCRKKKRKSKKHKRPKNEAKIPDALQLKVCAR